MNDKLPCKNCITLGMCMANVNRNNPSVFTLMKKCKLLCDYISQVLLETDLAKFYSPPYNYSSQLLKVKNEFDDKSKSKICKSIRKRLSIVFKFFKINYTITSFEYNGDRISSSYKRIK